MTYAALQFTPAIFGKDGIFGGGERYVHSLAEALAEGAGPTWESRLVGFGKRDLAFVKNGVAVEVIAVGEHELKRLSGFSPLLCELFRRVDLVHIHQPFTYAGQLAAVAALQARIPFVITDLGAGNHRNAFALKVLNCASAIVSISEFSQRLLNDALEVEPIWFTSAQSMTIGFAPTPLSTAKGFSMLGRILPHKGVDRLIRSLPRRLKFTIAGDKPDNSYFSYLVELAKGKERYVLPSPDDATLSNLYSSHKAYCIGSTHIDYKGNYQKKPELMGITTMEALASGCPVVVSNTASLPEVIRGRFARHCTPI